jgi:cytochrome oxidase assembly protein ShyY1
MFKRAKKSPPQAPPSQQLIAQCAEVAYEAVRIYSRHVGKDEPAPPWAEQAPADLADTLEWTKDVLHGRFCDPGGFPSETQPHVREGMMLFERIVGATAFAHGYVVPNLGVRG